MEMNWYVIGKSNRRLFAIETIEPPAGAYPLDVYEIRYLIDRGFTMEVTDLDENGKPVVVQEASLIPEELFPEETKASGELSLTQEGKQWFGDHPNAILLFELSMAEIEAKVDAWDLSAIPNPARNEMRLTIQALVASVRVLAHQLGLLD